MCLIRLSIDMNYIGSKLTLLPFLKSVISDLAGGDIADKVLCDLFAGTGVVGRDFKSEVRKVISNDWEYYSYVLNRNYIGNKEPIKEKQHYLDYLNEIKSIDSGFIYRNYCLGSGSGRQYFSDDNGKKIDAARTQIELWYDEGEINDDLYYFLLCSLLESADKYANTASVYGAFLKSLKKTAQRPLKITASEFEVSGNPHEVYQEDANTLIRKIKGDILYMDPPYNERQYGANYHMLNTMAEYKPFSPKGKTGLRDYRRSCFCKKSEVQDRLEDILANASFRYIVLSYNNEGLMPFDTIRKIMEKYGYYDCVEKQYNRFRADKEESRKHKADKTIEYVHILEK